MNLSKLDLHNAVFKDDIKLVRQLLSVGHDIEERDPDGNTPFHMCCNFCSAELINLLIENGSDINAVNNNGETALLIALEKRVDYLIAILLEHNVNVNAVKLSDNTSPLFRAIYRGKTELALKLLQAGADPNVEVANRQGGTSLQWAADTGDLELVKQLLFYGAELNSPGILHCAVRHAPILRYLLSMGSNVNQKSYSGSTALHMAAYSCQTEAVKILIDFGADINIRDDEENLTPLAWAKDSDNQCEEVIALLS